MKKNFLKDLTKSQKRRKRARKIEAEKKEAARRTVFAKKGSESPPDVLRNAAAANIEMLEVPADVDDVSNETNESDVRIELRTQLNFLKRIRPYTL